MMLDIDFNESDEELQEILGQSRVIAKVGESNDHYYTSYQVAQYLKKMGYKVYPVNPNITTVDGDRNYPKLERVMNLQDMSHHLHEILEHQNGKGQESETSQRFGQAFVITRQTSEASRPSKTAFHHPTSGQQDEAFLGTRQFDHFQTQAFSLSGLGRVFSGVSLIHEGDLDRL